MIVIDSGRLLLDGVLTELSRRFAGYETIAAMLSEPADLLSYGEVIGDGGTSRTTIRIGREAVAEVTARLLAEQTGLGSDGGGPTDRRCDQTM